MTDEKLQAQIAAQQKEAQAHKERERERERDQDRPNRHGKVVRQFFP